MQNEAAAQRIISAWSEERVQSSWEVTDRSVACKGAKWCKDNESFLLHYEMSRSDKVGRSVW